MDRRATARFPWQTFQPPPRLLAANRRFTKRQEELLEKLERLVFAQGFAHLRVADIRDHVGCAWATLYKIAPSRDQLILLVVDRFYQRLFRNSAKATTRHRDARALLTEWLEQYAEAVAGVSTRFAHDADRNAAMAPLIERYQRYMMETLTGVIEVGIQQGSIRKLDPVVAAHLWFAGPDRLYRAGLANRPGRGWKDAVKQFHAIFFNGVASRSGDA